MPSFLNYPTPAEPPVRNWSWPTLPPLVVLGAIVFVTCLQHGRSTQFVEAWD